MVVAVLLGTLTEAAAKEIVPKAFVVPVGIITVSPKYACFATAKPPAVLSDAAVVLVAWVVSEVDRMPVTDRVPPAKRLTEPARTPKATISAI